MKRVIIISIFLIGNAFAQENIVFQSGEGGYDFFRIPAIVHLKPNQLIAFAEGRVNGSGDFGNVDIVYKESQNGGETWTILKTLIDNKTLQAGNPAPVIDMMDPLFPNGVLYLFYNTGNNHENEVRKGNGVREVWYVKSTDGAKNWSTPVNITLQVHRPNNPAYNASYVFKEDWRSYANTPGHALQISSGKFAGRLIVPANHSSGNPISKFLDYRAHLFFSDDHGKTFHLSDDVDIPGSNESTAAELSKGGVLMNIRNQSGNPRNRILSFSSSGGQHWDTTYSSEKLIDPVCQGSLLNIQSKKKSYLLFSNAHSMQLRDSLSIHLSSNDGHSWELKTIIDKSPLSFKGDWTAYSDLVEVNTKSIGIIYERNNYKEIVFKKIDKKKIIN